MHITPDEIIYWQQGFLKINATLVFTWVVMAILALGSWLVTRRVSSATPLPRGQNLLEAIVEALLGQIREVIGRSPQRFLPFIGTLFLFIAVSNLLTIVPGYRPPTGSLSTTAALALCVFMAVPLFGITDRGVREYLSGYVRPSAFMLPFNILGELTRTVALAIRLFGNVMSGSMIAATVLSIAPLIFPIFLNALGLLIGLIQAYIFSILALVFIASTSQAHEEGALAEAGDSTEEMHHG